jgi:hypothetical protein
MVTSVRATFFVDIDLCLERHVSDSHKMEADPCLMALTRPELSTVAMDSSLVDHLT